MNRKQRKAKLKQKNAVQSEKRQAALLAESSCGLLEGRNLASTLNRRIDAMAQSEGVQRSEIVRRMGEAAGISPSTVAQILNFDGVSRINCPPRNRLEGFAQVLGMSINTLIAAARGDGCSYVDEESHQMRGESIALNETLESPVVKLLEAEEGRPRRLRAVGITAGVINGNRRRYPAHVLADAVARTQRRMEEGAVSGRAILTGEAEHPSDKGQRPNILETVVKWILIEFDGHQVWIEGVLVPTSKGKDLQALVEAGVYPPISQRAYGTSEMIDEGGVPVQEITHLDFIEAYDFVMTASDPQAQVVTVESKELENEDNEMGKETNESTATLDLSTLTPVQIQQMAPDLAKGVHEALEAQRLDEERKQREAEEADRLRIEAAKSQELEGLREALGLTSGDDMNSAIAEMKARADKLQREKDMSTVASHIESRATELKYPDDVRKDFVEAVHTHGDLVTVEQANRAIQIEAKKFNRMMAKLELVQGQASGLHVLGPVIEESGTPAFAEASYRLIESMKHTPGFIDWNLKAPKTRAQQFGLDLLRKYESHYKLALQQESQSWNEALDTQDLELPATVGRILIQQCMPQLVAAEIFNVAPANGQREDIYYEDFQLDECATEQVSVEVTVPACDCWIDVPGLEGLIPDSQTVIDAVFGELTYGQHYVLDFMNGRIYIPCLDTSDHCINPEGDPTPLTFPATITITGETNKYICAKECAPIEMGQTSLVKKTLDLCALRLATEICRDTIVFSRSQLGWDVVNANIRDLMRRIREEVDKQVFYQALSGALSVPFNSGGTWNAATGSLDQLVAMIGRAKALMGERGCGEATAIVTTISQADLLSNWDGFCCDNNNGDRTLLPNGYVGRLKGLPVYQTNNWLSSHDYILVVNEDLVFYRMMGDMQIKGPYHAQHYDDVKKRMQLKSSEFYYAEAYVGLDVPVPEKAAYVKIV